MYFMCHYTVAEQRVTSCETRLTNMTATELLQISQICQENKHAVGLITHGAMEVTDMYSIYVPLTVITPEYTSQLINYRH